MKQNKEQAREYLAKLDRDETVFSFHCYDPEKKKKPKANIVGTIDDCWDELCGLNTQGYGIYIAVNAVDGDRNKANVCRIRAAFQEDDDHFNGDLPIDPSMVVNTSPGKYHRYFTTSKTVDDESRQNFGSVMRCMVESYGSDKNAKDISRVLRVPGFFNTKPDLDKPHLVKVTNGTGGRYAWKQITEAFKPPPRKERPQTHSESNSDLDEALSALDAISPDQPRQEWLNIGTALKEGFGEIARSYWINWSLKSTNPKHNQTAEQLAREWDSLSVNAGVHLNTLFYHAYETGWRETRQRGQRGQEGQTGPSYFKTGPKEDKSRTEKGQRGQEWGEIRNEVKEYVFNHDSDVEFIKLCQHLGYVNRSCKKKVHSAISFLVKNGDLKKHPIKRGVYQRTGTDIEVMKPKVDRSSPLPLSFSLNLHNNIKLKQGTVIVVGGATNTGKTLMAMDLLRRWVGELSQIYDSPLTTTNPDNSLREFVELSPLKDSRLSALTGIRYLNSEMTDEELGDLLADMGDDGEMVNNSVEWVRRTHDYPGAVLTDGITFLDFLQIHRDFYEVGGIISEMADRVGKGLLVVFIQKKSGESFPRGGDFALERSRIALLLDYAGPNVSSCYLRKIKFPQDKRNHPERKEIDFTILDNLALKPVSELRFLSKGERLAVNRSYGAKN